HIETAIGQVGSRRHVGNALFESVDQIEHGTSRAAGNVKHARIAGVFDGRTDCSCYVMDVDVVAPGTATAPNLEGFAVHDALSHDGDDPLTAVGRLLFAISIARAQDAIVDTSEFGIHRDKFFTRELGDAVSANRVEVVLFANRQG